MVTFVPCIYNCVGPLLARWSRAVYDFLSKILVFLVMDVIVPTIVFLHNNGIFEAALYLGAFQLVLEGTKFDTTEQYGFMISLTGILSLPLLMSYSMMLHTRKIRSDGSNKPTVLKMLMLWWVLCIVPVAITFHSTLMGYVSYFILFCLIFTII